MAKPLWTVACQHAQALIKQAQEAIENAQELRCTFTIDGARCTADSWPLHEHRVREADRP